MSMVPLLPVTIGDCIGGGGSVVGIFQSAGNLAANTRLDSASGMYCSIRLNAACGMATSRSMPGLYFHPQVPDGGIKASRVPLAHRKNPLLLV